MRGLKLVVSIVLATVCSLVTAYYHSFASLAFYDDEGLMLFMVKQFVVGTPVYDRLHSIYGPAYYLYQWCAHVLMGVPVSSDGIRFVAIFFWLAASVLVLLLVYRMTRSSALAVVGHLTTFHILSFIGEEPAHPQELCIVLLLSVALAATYTTHRRVMTALLGILAAAVVATKINLGVYVTAALAVMFVLASRTTWIRRVVSIPVIAGAFLLPLVLMESRLNEPWALRYCVLIVIALMAAMWVLAHTELDVRLTTGDCAISLCCFAATLAVLAGFAVVHGNTVGGMFQSLVFVSRAIMQYWFVPAPIKLLALPWVTAGLACAWYVRGPVHPALLNTCKLIYAVVVIVLCADSRYGGVLNFAPAFLWLVAVCPGHADSCKGQSFTRNTIAVLGVLQALYAYPVAGATSQVAFTTVLPLVAALVCLSDVLSFFPLLRPRWGFIAATVLISGFYLTSAWNARRNYERLVSLNLPGAQLIHLEPQRVATLQTLVADVPPACTMLLTAPVMFSFNFWTGKPAPAYVPIGAWVLGAKVEEQEDAICQMSREAQPCVVYNQKMIYFWTNQRDVSSQPLARYIRENFHTAYELDGYRIMIRN
jgi:hypothetical protein